MLVLTTMKIAVLSDSEANGGAAIVAARLSDMFGQLGADVLRVVGQRNSTKSAVVDVGHLRPHEEIIRSALARAGFRNTAQRWHAIVCENGMVSAVRRFRPDVVHVHNLHGAGLTLRLLSLIQALGVPIVWTLHDMWAFTGGCAYAYDCDAFSRASCDENCPNPDDYPPLDPLQVRRHILSRHRFFTRSGRGIVVVAPSSWLAGEARRSVLSGNRIEVISNGVSSDAFAPLPKSACRTALSLPDDLPIILAGGVSLSDPRKGWCFLARALEDLSQTHRFRLVTFGRHEPVETSYPMIRFGEVHDERLLRLVYGAADAFAFPSLADNLPSVLLEAVACGTPAVAFDVGGVSEVVCEGLTGFLARARDASDLARKLRTVLSIGAGARQSLAQSCRAFAVEKFDVVKQANRYLDLFASIVDSNGRKAPVLKTPVTSEQDVANSGLHDLRG